MRPEQGERVAVVAARQRVDPRHMRLI